LKHRSVGIELFLADGRTDTLTDRTDREDEASSHSSQLCKRP